MKGVILAAGLGIRLKSKIPKVLTILKDDKSILDFQIQSLSHYLEKDSITIVTGFMKKMIEKKFPMINTVFNKRFKETNTSKSLLLALENYDDDVLWMNGDIYFNSKILTSLIKSEFSACLVDNKKCKDEEVKYTCDRDGFINRLSKSLRKAEGEALGINLIKKSDLPSFKDELKRVADQDYFEKALENLIMQKKLKLKPLNIGHYFCKEIDFPKDLKVVRNYLKN